MSRTSSEKREKTKGLHLTIGDGDYLDILCGKDLLRIHFHGKNGHNVYQVSCVGDREHFKISSSRSKNHSINKGEIVNE